MTMRPRILITTVLLAAAAVLTARWVWVRAESERLQAERDALRTRSTELARLKAEQRRLHDALADATRLAALRNAAAVEVTAAIAPPASPAPTRLVLGEWAASDTWTNRGQATASAAVETALWAAAGGDVQAFAGLLELDAPTRLKAAELLARLPAEAQQAFGSPEGLVAIAATKAIPLTEAQVVWFNEISPDTAAMGLLFAKDEPESVALENGPDAAAVSRPPALADSGASKMTFLSLRRVGFTWRLVVPPSAIDRIAREMRAPTGP
jgi:hypothetical protein